MSIQRINFTSSLLDKARFNTHDKTVEKDTEQEVKENSAVAVNETIVESNDSENAEETSETLVATEPDELKPEKHTARNWTIGLSAAAVLTGLGVLAGRHGYMGEGIQRVLKGAKKEAGELIDDVSESVTGSINRATGEAPVKPAEEASGTVLGRINEEGENIGTVLGRAEDDTGIVLPKGESAAENEGTVLGRVADEETGLNVTTSEETSGTVLGRVSEEEGSAIGRTSDDLAEQEPLINPAKAEEKVEEGFSSPFLSSDDSQIVEETISEIFSKDGKFKIPQSRDEVDMKATRKYLKAKKIKVPKKYRKLPEFKIEDIIGDFKPENVDKSKIVDGVYVHQLPKGERLEVHISPINDVVSRIERYNKKGKQIGTVKYNVFNSGVDYVEHPNGFRYDFTWDASAIDGGSRTVGKNTYFYNESGNIKRLEQKISDSVERKVTFENDGKIDGVTYYVNTSEGRKVVKEDIYYHDDNYIREDFDINGDSSNFVSNRVPMPKSFFQRLKFWQSEGFKKFIREITEEEDI